VVVSWLCDKFGQQLSCGVDSISDGWSSGTRVHAGSSQPDRAAPCHSLHDVVDKVTSHVVHPSVIYRPTLQLTVHVLAVCWINLRASSGGQRRYF